MPMTGQPIKTINIPPIKNPVAFTLCLWKKNLKVLSSPITNASPLTNRICKGKKRQRETGKQHKASIRFQNLFISI